MDILLVDDDEVVLEVVGLMLEAEGHRVVPVGSGSEALRRLDAGLRVHLVLTDLTMPDTNGREVARAVRERWPGIRVGLITGTPEQVLEASRAIDVVIGKPVTLEALRGALAGLAIGEGAGG